MKRDFDLVRKIILEIRELPANSLPVGLEYPDEYDQDVVNEHIRLLIEAGLIEGNIIDSLDGIFEVQVHRLTWNGQDFADSIQDETLWKKAKSTVLKPAVSFTFDLLLQWLKSQAGALIGLP